MSLLLAEAQLSISNTFVVNGENQDLLKETEIDNYLNSAPHPVLLLDSRRNLFIAANAKAVERLQMSKEELLEQNLISLSEEKVLGWNARDYLDAAIERACRGGIPAFDWFLRTPLGLELKLELRIFLSPFSRPHWLQVNLIDKEQLTPTSIMDHREIEERYKLALRSSDMGCFDWFPQESRLYWDEEMKRIFRLPSDRDSDVLNHFREVVHPEDQQRVNQELENLIDENNSEQRFEQQYRIVVEGQVFYIKSFGYVFRNQAGKLVRMIGTCQDVTPIKSKEEELKIREQRLSLIFNNNSDFMILLRKEGGSFYLDEINENCLVHIQENFRSGLSREEVLGKGIVPFLKNVASLSEGEIDFRISQMEKACSQAENISFDTSTQIAGQKRYEEHRVIPIFVDAECSYLLWVHRDVSERIESRQQLVASLKEVKELRARLEKENRYLREEIGFNYNFHDMVFGSEEFRRILRQAEQVAPTSATVLIEGETGTGKELVARAIHNLSPRKNMPMFKINCSAIPHELIESELFGYEKGAFTGAEKRKEGKFELAHGGSLFLDEIGEMPLDAQVKLLRVIQEGEIQRLGSTKTQKIDVRIIAATNRKLKREVEKNTFREDLFFRINVFPIYLPPLRERKEDIQVLVEHFVHKYAKKHNKSFSMISLEAMQAMEEYDWPGNIRELENIIERAVILSENERLVIPGMQQLPESEAMLPKDKSLAGIQKYHITKVLHTCNWKIEGAEGAAAILDIKPSTLRDKMKKMGIRRPE